MRLTSVKNFGHSSGILKGLDIASSMPAAKACSTCSIRAFALTAKIGNRVWALGDAGEFEMLRSWKADIGLTDDAVSCLESAGGFCSGGASKP